MSHLQVKYLVYTWLWYNFMQTSTISINIFHEHSEMQSRIVDLIGRVTHDEITAELLRLNDELNNLFLRYQRYEKNRDPKNTSTPSAILGAALRGSNGKCIWFLYEFPKLKVKPFSAIFQIETENHEHFEMKHRNVLK